MSTNELRPMLPHRYPIWVIAFGIGIFGATAFALALLPHYLQAATELKSARLTYLAKNFDAAITGFEKVLVLEPTSKTARIGEAKAIFSKGDSNGYERGLDLLASIELSKSEWAELSTVLPPDLAGQFVRVKK